MRGPGYRYFTCEECGTEWYQATRDCTSPSKETCPVCDSLESPTDANLSLTLKTDRFGNLLAGQDQPIITKHGNNN